VKTETTNNICGLSNGKKVNVSLCLTKHHAMKTYWGVEIQCHTFLTSELGKAQWAPELVWKWWRREKFPAPAGNQTAKPQTSSL